MTRISKLLCATALIAAGAVSQANALPTFNQTFSANAASGVSGDNGTPLTITLGSNQVVNQLITNDLGLSIGNALTWSVSTVTSTTSGFTVTIGALTFTETGYVSGFQNGVAGSGLTFNGDFSETGYQTESGTLNVGFSAGLENSTNYSAFFNVTAPATVPEPISMSILGLGVAGLAAARRRRGGPGGAVTGATN